MLGVEEVAVGAGADLIDRRGVEIDEDGPGDVFAIARLSEKGVERASIADILILRVNEAVGCETVLEEVPGADS